MVKSAYKTILSFFGALKCHFEAFLGTLRGVFDTEMTIIRNAYGVFLCNSIISLVFAVIMSLVLLNMNPTGGYLFVFVFLNLCFYALSLYFFGCIFYVDKYTKEWDEFYDEEWDGWTYPD
jgi:hypothetical protein